jgi:curli biogenesis system outer membrane secretion channel CsgG
MMNRQRSFVPGVLAGLFTLAAVPLCSAPTLAQAPAIGAPGAERIRPRDKRRIAVLDFDFSGISNYGFLSSFYGGEGAAKGMSTLVTNQLVKDGKFIVVERSKIDAVIAEQNFGQSGRIEPTTAAQIGRILGVDAVLIGSVTKFDVEDKSKGVSLGSLFGIGGGDRKQIATVQIASRLVSTTTAEILTVAEGNGQATQSDGNVSVRGISGGSSSNSTGRILIEAAEQAIAQLSTQLAGAAPQLAATPPVVPVIDAVIADITGNEVVINKGGKAGFRPGMVLSVERVIKRINDPTTGKLLRLQTQSIGQLQLTEVDPQSSVAKILAGKGGIRVGDRARAVE